MFCFDPWDLMSGISDLKKSSWIWILLQKEWRMNSCAFEGGELKKKKMYTLISTPLENMNTLMNRYGHSSCLVPHLSDLVDGFTMTWLQNQCWSGSYIQTLFLMGSPCYTVYFCCMKKAGQLSLLVWKVIHTAAMHRDLWILWKSSKMVQDKIFPVL